MLLATLAACGRIGYEGVAYVGDGDASTEGSEPMDQRAPDSTGSDVLPDEPAPDAAADVRPDVVQALPPDAGIDGAIASTVVAMGYNPTPRQGGSGGATADTCPDGGLLVGYEGTQSTNPNYPWIHSVVGVCAVVTFPPPGAPATAWHLTRLPARGSTGGDRWTRMCPAGRVLVGFDGNAAGWIGQLVFRCAPIALDPSGQAVVLGRATELDDVGAPATSDFPETDCPVGHAARGAETRTGSFLEAFGLICATPVLR